MCKTWTLVDYFDVWGNSKDGFEVNNLCKVADDIVIAEDATDTDIMQGLKSMGFLKKHVRLNMLIIEDHGDLIELSQRKDGKPLGRLECFN